MMAAGKREMIEVSKDKRDEYPNFKTITELKAMKLMPKPNVKPRALLVWSFYNKRQTALLYDIALTKPYALTEKQKAERRRKSKEKQRLKKLELENEKRMQVAQRKRELLFERIEKVKNAHLQQLLESVAQNRTLVIDTETTGLDFDDEILQISIITDTEEVLFNSYIKPAYHTKWPEAERINHINYQMVKTAPKLEDVWVEIETILLSASKFITYNGRYDIGKLEAFGFVFPKNFINYDVMRESAPIFAEWDSYHKNFRWKSLWDCAEYFGYSAYNAPHDSLEDVRATLFCYNAVENYEGIIYDESMFMDEEDYL